MTRFVVPDMECQGCVKAVTGAVQGVDPAAKVAVNLDTKVVEVESQAAVAALSAAITEAGFTVESAA